MIDIKKLAYLAKKANEAGQGTYEMACFRLDANPAAILDIVAQMAEKDKKLQKANEHTEKFEREMYLMMDKAEAAEAYAKSLNDIIESRKSDLRAAEAEQQRRIAELESWQRGIEAAMVAATDRAEAAEAELSRRDQAAGERAGVVEVWPGTRSCDFLLSRPLPVGQHNLYTEQPPVAAVLPPEKVVKLPKKIPDEFYQVLYQQCGGFVDGDTDPDAIWAAVLKLSSVKRGVKS